MHLFEFLSLLLLLIFGFNVEAGTVCHDETFIPDAILRVTAENQTTSCLPSKSTVMVNGTAPGPELRLVEGRTYWIRVYNDMPDVNLTMVHCPLLPICHILMVSSIGMDSRWLCHRSPMGMSANH